MTVSAITKIPTGEWISKYESETFDLGIQIGDQLGGGEIILLNGPLGAGKTILVKGIARALGIDEKDVTSPSFTLVNPHRGRLLLYHIDLYRVEAGKLEGLGLEDIFDDPEAVVIVEWAEQLGTFETPGAVRVYLEYVDECSRKIEIR